MFMRGKDCFLSSDLVSEGAFQIIDAFLLCCEGAVPVQSRVNSVLLLWGAAGVLQARQSRL